jgi:hypothetical protein
MNMAGGDNDMDDNAAAPLWDGADDTSWCPEAWMKSPMQMQMECQAANQSHFAMAAAAAPKHDNPPTMPWMRNT